MKATGFDPILVLHRDASEPAGTRRDHYELDRAIQVVRDHGQMAAAGDAPDAGPPELRHAGRDIDPAPGVASAIVDGDAVASRGGGELATVGSRRIERAVVVSVVDEQLRRTAGDLGRAHDDDLARRGNR